jgi:hypothetical protein
VERRLLRPVILQGLELRRELLERARFDLVLRGPVSSGCLYLPLGNYHGSPRLRLVTSPWSAPAGLTRHLSNQQPLAVPQTRKPFPLATAKALASGVFHRCASYPHQRRKRGTLPSSQRRSRSPSGGSRTAGTRIGGSGGPTSRPPPKPQAVLRTTPQILHSSTTISPE